jgi:hypothetical protein
VVVALAIALVVIRDLPNGSVVPATASTSTGPGGIPLYYVGLTPTSSKSGAPNGLVVGDSLTGKTIAALTPPTGTSFASVSGTSDDRTFVALNLANPRNSKLGQAGSWYKVTLAPGTAHPATLTHLPIEPRYGVVATALSASGKELAVATEAAGLPGEPSVKELDTFSLTNGQLLNSWTTKDATALLPAAWTAGETPSQFPVLTWTDNDQAITFTAVGPAATALGTLTVRKLNATQAGNGDLMAASQVIWTAPTTGTPTEGDTRGMTCAVLLLSRLAPLVSADGKTIGCATVTLSATLSVTFSAYHLAADGAVPGPVSAGARQATMHYQVSRTVHGGSTEGGELLWVSPSGGTLIGAWEIGADSTSLSDSLPAHIGVISRGKFTPLRLPSGLVGIAW